MGREVAVVKHSVFEPPNLTREELEQKDNKLQKAGFQKKKLTTAERTSRKVLDNIMKDVSVSPQKKPTEGEYTTVSGAFGMTSGAHSPGVDAIDNDSPLSKLELLNLMKEEVVKPQDDEIVSGDSFGKKEPEKKRRNSIKKSKAPELPAKKSMIPHREPMPVRRTSKDFM